jgi:hypothetical protein
MSETPRIPPPPASRRTPPSGKTYFRDLVVDLAVRIEWLEQVIDSVPEPQASSDAQGQLRGWTKALRELHHAVLQVQEHVEDTRFAKLFALEAPLAAFLSRLYAWCEEITGDFESLAVKLRQQQPVYALFSYRAVSDSYQRFQNLAEALREAVAESRPMTPESQAAWRTFDSDFEELLWATEWMHMSLAKKPGT